MRFKQAAIAAATATILAHPPKCGHTASSTNGAMRPRPYAVCANAMIASLSSMARKWRQRLVQGALRRCCCHLRHATPSSSNWRKACRLTLPLLLSGISLRAITRLGTMYDGIRLFKVQHVEFE